MLLRGRADLLFYCLTYFLFLLLVLPHLSSSSLSISPVPCSSSPVHSLHTPPRLAPFPGEKRKKKRTHPTPNPRPKPKRTSIIHATSLFFCLSPIVPETTDAPYRIAIARDTAVPAGRNLECGKCEWQRRRKRTLSWKRSPPSGSQGRTAMWVTGLGFRFVISCPGPGLPADWSVPIFFIFSLFYIVQCGREGST